MNAPTQVQSVELDKRLAVLAIAATHYELVTNGYESVEEGFNSLTAFFDIVFPLDEPCCPTCGLAPCGNPSFCAACRRADAKRGHRR
jgi:hypothetical protein